MQIPPIGILSGTFDPIHLGHIHLATEIQKICCLQKTLLIPCFNSPIKDKPFASTKDRLIMAKLAVKNINNFQVDDREIKRSGLSFTIETLKSLRAEYINTPLALIMGTDVFNKFDEWHEWKHILDLTHLLIANRPNSWNISNLNSLKLLKKHQTNNIQQLQKQNAGLIYLTDIKPLPISATEIRTLLKNKKRTEHLLPADIYKYIYKKKLYV
jgi:nicotinate-nucleotide adenylyltransferase